jgi:predicted HAD superfamily Cof-like phosphohydrolase
MQNPDMIGDVEAFHKKFNQHYEGSPRQLEPSQQAFRMKFIAEEMHELTDAEKAERTMCDGSVSLTSEHFARCYRADQLDAICDLIYVLLGYAHLRGWNVAEAWRRVQFANMSKTPASAGEGRHSTDIVKPLGFFPPNHEDLV